MPKQTSAATETASDDPRATVSLWMSEIERAKKSAGPWTSQAKDTVKRFRLDDVGAGVKKGAPRYNVLWSNTKTLGPALYAQPPKIVVQRRFLDKDPVGRVACQILERAVQYQVDEGELHDTVKLCVQDRLLSGRGTAWARYEPDIETVDDDPGNDGSNPDDPVAERIRREIVHVDYVHWQDFLHGPARYWGEVPWVAKREYLDRDAVTRLAGQEMAAAVQYNVGPDPDRERDSGGSTADDALMKAEVWEIWDKASKRVLFVSEGCDQPLKTEADPLQLKGFFPCPRPLYATTTTDTLVPVPDYEQYKPQAREMDTITKRIDRIVSAIRVKGAYDARFGGLADMLDEAGENDLVPVESWAEFAQSKGFDGVMDFMPIEPFVKALEQLYAARKEVKSEIYEITGLSDILRGEGDADETATGVRTKGRFATLRLQDDQADVARFVRDIVRLIAEITCGLFQAETLAEMASCEEMDELQLQVPAAPPPGVPPSPGAPPMMPQRLPMGAGGMA